MRVCFHLQVRTDKLEEYARLHAQPPGELLDELKSAGIRNYSLYLWEGGHEFGVLECDDWDAVQEKLSSSQVIAHWESTMSDFLVNPVIPGESPKLLTEVFRMD